MEPEKLRGISIIAAGAFDSEKPRGIAIPAVRAVVADAFLLTRSLSGTFSSPGSVPIRAPLTVDEEDDDSGSVTDEHNLASSDATSYSKGLDSGTDDGFESVNGDADDEAELEDVVMGVIRVLGEEVVGETVDGSDFTGEIEEETSVNYSSLEEESESEVSDADGISMKAKVVIPRAILSLDDDEFDEVLASGDEEAEVKDRTLQFGDVRMVDEPECSYSVVGDVVSTEDEAVEMKVTDQLEDCLTSFGSIEDLSLGVQPGGSKDFMVENEASIGLVGSSKQLIDKGVVQTSIIKDDGDEVDPFMKPEAVGLGELTRTYKPECSGSGTGELVNTDEDMVQEKFSDDGLVSFETTLGVAPGDRNEFVVKTEGNADDADRGLDETFSWLVEQGVDQENVSKESGNKIDYGSVCEADESIIPGDVSIGLGSRESEDEDTGFMTGDATERTENSCSAVRKLEKQECEGEPEIDMSSESGCGSSHQKVEQEAENEESEDTDRKLSLPNEDRARSSFETANESVEDGDQISERVNKQVNFQSDSEQNQISVGIEETSLLSVKDVENSETQMARLIHNHTCMELGEYEEAAESSFQNYSEELSPDHSVQLISEKVKERVEKTKLLKEKLQRIIRGIHLCSESSAVTEVESQKSLVGGEHQMSLGTKTMLPEKEFPVGLDFSVNVIVIGKTGVGKSATINSIFGETKSAVGAFVVTTKSSNYLVGNVGGILIRILDTPGLMSSATEERYNQDVLMSIKKSMRRFPVDVILYIERLDENPDIHLLRTITTSLGSSIWRNAIVVLTHAASDSSSYKDFIAQRSFLMHQSIREAVPELSCVDRSKMPGIVLAENNVSSLCGNNTSESNSPDWRLNLLILCCSFKIRSEAGSLLKQNTLVEKGDAFGSPLPSFTLFCSLWNVLLLGANKGQASHSLVDFDEKKRRLLESYPEILWDGHSQECLEKETLAVKNQEAEDDERVDERNMIKEKGSGLGRVRTRRGRLGFQATKRLGIYLDTSDLHTGFSIGSRGSIKEEQEEGRILVRMRGSMAVLGLVPMLMSVLTSVYGRKYI